MKYARTPLLLALFPLLATAGNTPPPQATDLATVTVEADSKTDTTSIGSYGNASIHDTPAAVTVITREQLSDHHVRSLREIAQHDASLGDNYAAIGYYQNISIRGFPLDLATSYRMNNLTVVGEQRVALANKQRVEVLKGLAGIQAGVMEPGGVVNYVTKRPADVRNVTLGTDSHGSRYVALDVGAWLTDNFGVRANIAWNQTHSWVPHADGRRNFYSIAADWRITPDATLEVDSSYQSIAQRSVSGYQLLGGTEIPQHPSDTQLLGYQPWQQPVTLHTSNTSVRFNDALSKHWTLHLAAGHSRSVIGDNVAFAYGCFYVKPCYEGGSPGNYFAPNGDYDIYDYRSPDDTRVADQARASLDGQFHTGSIKHEITVGIGAFHRTVDRRIDVYDYVGTANIADPIPPVFAPSPNQPGPSARRLGNWQHTAWLLDRMHFGQHWQWLVGAHQVRLHERTWDDTGVPERDTRMNRTLPQTAVLWQPNTALTLYASYSEGLSLGKEAPYWTSNDGDFLGPRLTHQVEAGAKYRVTDTLNLTAALYHIRQPYQYAQPDDTAAGFTFAQDGEEVHDGLELGAHGQLTDNLRINASLSYIRAQAENTGTPTYEGHQVVNVPKLRTALYLQYRLPFAPKLTVLGGWRYAAPNPATPDGVTRVPAYNVFNAGLRYRNTWGQHKMTWRLSVTNLFDTFYWRDTGSSLGDHYLFPGTPRLARLTLTIGL